MPVARASSASASLTQHEDEGHQTPVSSRNSVTTPGNHDAVRSTGSGQNVSSRIMGRPSSISLRNTETRLETTTTSTSNSQSRDNVDDQQFRDNERDAASGNGPINPATRNDYISDIIAAAVSAQNELQSIRGTESPDEQHGSSLRPNQTTLDGSSSLMIAGNSGRLIFAHNGTISHGIEAVDAHRQQNYPMLHIHTARPISQFSPVHASPTSARVAAGAMSESAAAAVAAAAVLASTSHRPVTQNLSSAPSSSTLPVSNTAPNSTRYRSKPVCSLVCRYCSSPVCNRGMKAILLADSGVELFSTDSPPPTVGFALDDYITEKCFCRIRDVACLSCGNQVGYHVTQPCKTCLSSCNNGHFWMFYKEHVKFSERTSRNGGKSVVWSELPTADKDIDILERRFEAAAR